MERALDREAKLKKDAKRLIVHAVGRQAPEMERTVKAWLKKDTAYINEGPVYSKEYRQLLEKEIHRNRKDMAVMDLFREKGLFKV